MQNREIDKRDDKHVIVGISVALSKTKIVFTTEKGSIDIQCSEVSSLS